MKATTPENIVSTLDRPLELVYAHHAKWSREYNSLFVGADGVSFYLADTDHVDTDVPITEPEPVSLVEAADWYVRCQGFFESAWGEPSALIEAMADALRQPTM